MERSAQIAAATSKDSDGRVRYRGQQKRGQQPKWQLNLQDVRHVRMDFETFEKAVRILATPEARQRHAGDREKVEREAAVVGGSMIRRTDDILERLGHPRNQSPTGLPDPDELPDPEDDTLNYKRSTDAARIAAAATVGQLIYAPPLDVVSGRRETGKQSKPPDLGPLRAALAAKGLGLESEGAFYWRVVTAGKNGE